MVACERAACSVFCGGIVSQELFKKQVCMIIGSGGVGSCTGLTLARLGVKHISFFDMDVVEASNLNRQLLFSADQVGTMKATACKESVEKLHSFRTSASAINGDAVIEWKNVVAEAKRTSATAIFNG
jgi:tRNA A37 threonylcarbamoyladenosine dehydratase